MATDTLCFLSVSLRSGPVTAVEFSGPNTVASSSEDGSTKFLDVRTGQEATKALPEVPEGFVFSKQGGAKKQRRNGYVVAAKGKTLCIFTAGNTDGAGKAETTPKEETAPVAFFQCDSEIQAFDVANLERSNLASNLAVGCADGQVLQLWAAVLQTQV